MDIDIVSKYIDGKVDPKIVNNIVYYEVRNNDIVDVVKNLLAKPEISLKLITATDERNENKCFKVWYVFGVKTENVFVVPYIKLSNTTEFNSITSITQVACNYERKINTFFGLKPIGNPDTRPILLHENWPQNIYPLRKDFIWNNRPEFVKGEYKFREIFGEGIYEIPVGPIHAGIIEPGHFRFSVAGEEILNLEAKLGYNHKGIEKLFETLSFDNKLKLSEKVSGDSSFSHSLAYCQALEQLANIKVTQRVQYLRVVFAELERIANHFGDIGAIMLDTGFNFGGANGSRLREMILKINEDLTGSRFLRGVNTIGGVLKDISNKAARELIKRLSITEKDFYEVIKIANEDSTLHNRLNNTGELLSEIAVDYGAVGVSARALGIMNDVRYDFNYESYKELGFAPASNGAKGDVHARFDIRVKEVYSSITLIKSALEKLPKGLINHKDKKVNLNMNSFGISMVEGWRGEIIYFVMTNDKGEINRVALRDPSFINWNLVGYSGLNNIVPDFPLINKSYNLSYSGNDL